MKIINVILIFIALVSGSLGVAAKTSKIIIKPTVSPALMRAVQRFTDKHSDGVGKVKITESDIQGNWALIRAESIKKQMDPAQYLLHKEKGNWKVLVMGTALVGTGAEYKVPNNLRKKWNL